MNAQSIFQQHSKSFSFAAKWLPKNMRQHAAILYAFCRYCDDLADEAISEEQKTLAKQKLNIINQELKNHRSNHPIVIAMLELIERYNLPVSAAENLIAGVCFDLEPVRILCKEDLIDYAYKVAGTVGEMMCPILGCADKNASKYAVSLGIAMQLTNIVRDVHEDALLNRLYLPQEWLEYEDPRLCLDDHYRATTQLAMKKTLDLAEGYYQHASKGLHYIPKQPRLAIIIALRIYRSIGLKIAQQNYSYWLGRVATNHREKVIIATKAGLDYWRGHYQHDHATL